MLLINQFYFQACKDWRAYRINNQTNIFGAEDLNEEFENRATAKLLQELTKIMGSNNRGLMIQYRTYEEYREAANNLTFIANARETDRKVVLIRKQVQQTENQRVEKLFNQASGERLHVILDPHVSVWQPSP